MGVPLHLRVLVRGPHDRHWPRLRGGRRRQHHGVRLPHRPEPVALPAGIPDELHRGHDLHARRTSVPAGPVGQRADRLRAARAMIVSSPARARAAVGLSLVLTAVLTLSTLDVHAVTRLPSADGQFWDVQDTSPWAQDSGGIATGGRANPFNGFGYLKLRVRSAAPEAIYLRGFGLAHDGHER